MFKATIWMSALHRQCIKAGPQGMLWGRRDLAEIFARLGHALTRIVESYLYCLALGVKFTLLCALCSWQEVQPLSKSQR